MVEIALRKNLLDTNLLLLRLVDRTDPHLLRSFKRVQDFRYSDLKLLRDLLTPLTIHVTTPHVLAETSNLLNQAPHHMRPRLFAELRRYVEEVVEIYTPSETLMQRGEFAMLGLTDTALADLSSQAVVLTTDYRLVGKIEALGGQALNFNHHRSRDLAG